MNFHDISIELDKIQEAIINSNEAIKKFHRPRLDSTTLSIMYDQALFDIQEQFDNLNRTLYTHKESILEYIRENNK